MTINLEGLRIDGALLVSQDVHCDSRGAFEVFWEEVLLSEGGLSFRPSNAHHSYNNAANTLRGMHFQKSPHGQAKLVQCVSGRAFDVMVDLRPESRTFRRWHGVGLAAGSGKSVYIPAGCAHGFLTLEPNTTIAYLIEGEYAPGMGRVLKWNDATVGIDWPVLDPIMSQKDASAPEWNQCEF